MYANEHVIAKRLPPLCGSNMTNFVKDNKEKIWVCLLVFVGCERNFQGGVYIDHFGPHGGDILVDSMLAANLGSILHLVCFNL